jgi:transposase-like protein
MVTSMAVIVATGVTATGKREILGLDVGDSEDEVFWKGFMTGLKQRGLTGVRLVIRATQHSGLIAGSLCVYGRFPTRFRHSSTCRADLTRFPR